MSPVVPRYGQPKVQQEAMPGPRVTVSADEETFGGGAANKQVVSAATNLNTTLQTKIAEERENADKVRVQDAVNQLGMAESDILNQVGSMQGLDAATRAVQFGTDEHKKRVAEISKDLSPKQRQDFALHANRSYVEIYSKSNNHAAVQREEHDKASTNDRISGLTNKIAENVDNPKVVAIIKHDIQQVFLEKALRDKRVTQEEIKAGKFADATVTEDLFKVRNEANLNVAQALIDNGRPDRAKEYLNSIKSDEIDVEKKNRLKEVADAAFTKQKADAKLAIEHNYSMTTLEAGKAFTSGKLNLGMIDGWQKAGVMKPETASALTTALFSKKERKGWFDDDSAWKKFSTTGQGKNKKETYTDKGSFFVKMLRDAKDGQAAGELIMDGFKAYGSGLIEDKDLAWIVHIAQEAKDKKKITFAYNEALNASKYGTDAVTSMAQNMMESSYKVGYKKDQTFSRGGKLYKVIDDTDPFDPDVELVK